MKWTIRKGWPRANDVVITLRIGVFLTGPTCDLRMQGIHKKPDGNMEGIGIIAFEDDGKNVLSWGIDIVY